MIQILQPFDLKNIETQQLIAQTHAKQKEVFSLLNEQTLLNGLYSPHCITHPTKLTDRVNDLFNLYMQLPPSLATEGLQQLKLHNFNQISPAQKVAFLSQKTPNGYSLLEDMKKKIEEVIPSFILQTPTNSFFYHTDLVIYKNDYCGHLPINGIRHEEFLDINRLFNRIVRGQTKLIPLGSPHFKLTVNLAIGKLLTRSIGRQLLKSIIEPRFKNNIQNSASVQLNRFNIFITENHEESKVRLMSDNQNGYYFDLQMNTLNNCFVFIDNPPNHLLVAENPKLNECGSEKMPFYVCFAHELIHVRHMIHNRSWKSSNPTADELDLYTNENEKVTISGELNNQVKDVICENTIRKAFGLYPRKYHQVYYA